MLLDYLTPGAEVSEYVRVYRIADFVFSEEEVVPFKAYPPRPGDCLQFYPRDPESVTYSDQAAVYCHQAAALTGQHTVVSNRYIGRNFLTVQVVFQPGALYRLTGMPARELANGYLNAESVLGGAVRTVNEQLAAASSYREMIALVEAYLLGLVRKVRREAHVVDRISQLMVRHPDRYSIDWLAREACLCHRQLDRKFAERIGVGPKLYSRIIRFDRAFRMKNAAPTKDWLTVALHCGYHDYQHLVRDYRLLTGFTPAAFYAIETGAPERYFGDMET